MSNDLFIIPEKALMKRKDDSEINDGTINDERNL
jgi:hypothetical protein